MVHPPPENIKFLFCIFTVSAILKVVYHDGRGIANVISGGYDEKKRKC
jgi:hypothetical protein